MAARALTIVRSWGLTTLPFSASLSLPCVRFCHYLKLLRKLVNISGYTNENDMQSYPSRLNSVVLRLVIGAGFLLGALKALLVWGGGASHGSYLEGSTLRNVKTHLGISKESEATSMRTDDVSSSSTKAIIAPKMPTDDLSWISDFFPDRHAYIYVVPTGDSKQAQDIPSATHRGNHITWTLPTNKGHEASIYLTFIIDYYDSLPNYTVFLHGRRYQWHTDDPMYDFRALTHPPAPRPRRESRLHKSPLHVVPGCPSFVSPDMDNDDGFFGISSVYDHAFAEFFPGEQVP